MAALLYGQGEANGGQTVDGIPAPYNVHYTLYSMSPFLTGYKKESSIHHKSWRLYYGIRNQSGRAADDAQTRRRFNQEPICISRPPERPQSPAAAAAAAVARNAMQHAMQITLGAPHVAVVL